MSVQRTKTKKNYLIFFSCAIAAVAIAILVGRITFWVGVHWMRLPISRNWKKRRIMWNKRAPTKNGNAMASKQTSEWEWDNAKRGKKKYAKRKIIETIKNRLNWGCKNGNPQFFLQCHAQTSDDIQKREWWKDTKIFRRPSTVKNAHMENRISVEWKSNEKKIVMEMWWIELCACLLLNKAKIDAVILVANRKCNISKVSYRCTKNGFAYWFRTGNILCNTNKHHTKYNTIYKLCISKWEIAKWEWEGASKWTKKHTNSCSDVNIHHSFVDWWLCHPRCSFIYLLIPLKSLRCSSIH